MTRGRPLLVFVSFLSCSPLLNKAGISQWSQQSQSNLLYWFYLKTPHSHQSIDRLPAITGKYSYPQYHLNILFLLLLCYSGYHCLENTNASPVNLANSIFFRTGKCAILQIFFYGNLQRSSLYKYLPIAHFICMNLDVCLYTLVYMNLYINTSSGFWNSLCWNSNETS